MCILFPSSLGKRGREAQGLLPGDAFSDSKSRCAGAAGTWSRGGFQPTAVSCQGEIWQSALQRRLQLNFPVLSGSSDSLGRHQNWLKKKTTCNYCPRWQQPVSGVLKNLTFPCLLSVQFVSLPLARVLGWGGSGQKGHMWGESCSAGCACPERCGGLVWVMLVRKVITKSLPGQDKSSLWLPSCYV